MPSSHSEPGRLRSFLRRASAGFFEISHNGFTLIGLAVAFCFLTLATQPDLRQQGEQQLVDWLQERQAALKGLVSAPAPEAGERVTATDPHNLPRPQFNVVSWLSRKYSIAPEPLSVLVAAAYDTGNRVKLDPPLILAVMAIESGFNPYAQSSVGAQGLMQVMTKMHSEKFESFGGDMAAFDPLSNLRVGIRVLQECIDRAGSLEGGLKSYVGAANLDDDGGYTAKVLAEYGRLQMVAAGRQVPLMPTPATASPAKPAPTEHLASL